MIEPGMKVVLRIQEPGDRKPRQVGKVVPFCGRLIYAYNIEANDRMRALDAWGIAPCVLKFLLDHDVSEIHFADIAERVTWATTPRRVLQLGIPMQFDRRAGVYLHLPRAHWKRNLGVMNKLYPWATQMLDLSWIEPNELRETERQEGMEPMKEASGAF